jgi:hypothetical protein
LAGVAALALPPAVARAQPEPVLAGLWAVFSLLTVERRDAAAGEVLPPPQARQYRICIGPERARAPMLPSSLPRGHELIFESSGYQGSFDLLQAAAASQRQQVEFNYRRLSATAFEGSHDVSSVARVARLQYHALYQGPDCGELKPSVPSEAGEP